MMAKKGAKTLDSLHQTKTATQSKERQQTPFTTFTASASIVAPAAVTTTSKPSSLLDDDSRSPPPILQQHRPAISTSFAAALEYSNNNKASIPPPPLMRFTSSIFKNDLPMPFPNLATSQSFGPNGFLAPAALQTATSMGQSLIGGPLLTTPVPGFTPYNNNNPDSAGGDISMAASALLDLTPAAAATKKRDDPYEVTKPAAIVAPAVKRGKTLNRGKTVQQMAAITAQNSSTFRNDPMQSRARTLLENPPRTILACKCKNSQCLKLYCQCFQMGAVCDELICSCKDCRNSIAESKPRGKRTIAVHEILHRRPNAFEPREKKKKGQGCSCKKSK